MNKGTHLVPSSKTWPLVQSFDCISIVCTNVIDFVFDIGTRATRIDEKGGDALGDDSGSLYFSSPVKIQ